MCFLPYNSANQYPTFTPLPMKIYTKTGDTGTTALGTGSRVPKHHIRVEGYGTLDELNAFLGLLRDRQIDAPTKATLLHIQKKLFALGALLALAPTNDKPPGPPPVATDDLAMLERDIDHMNEKLPPLTHFILPGGHPTVSYCHIARTVCRRAERQITHLHQIQPLPHTVLAYINRLSDYLFVLARKLAKDLKAQEVQWIS